MDVSFQYSGCYRRTSIQLSVVVVVVVVFSSGSVEQTASGPSRQASRSQAGAAEAMMTICDDVMTM